MNDARENMKRQFSVRISSSALETQQYMPLRHSLMFFGDLRLSCLPSYYVHFSNLRVSIFLRSCVFICLSVCQGCAEDNRGERQLKDTGNF